MKLTKQQGFLLLTGFLVFVGMVVLILVGLSISLTDLRKQEEQKNLALSHLLTHAYGGEIESLLRGDSADAGLLQTVLQDQLETTSAVKVNLFDAKGLTVYSTDQGAIGEVEFQNAHLQTALTGSVASEYETFVRATNGTEENLRVVSIYLPVYEHELKGVVLGASETKKVVGVFELYSDVTPQIRALNLTYLGLGLAATVMLSLVFGGVYFLLRRSGIALEKHQHELERYAHLVRHTPTILFEVTKAGRVIYLNPSARKRFPELNSSELSISDLDSSDLSDTETLKHPLLTGWESITNNLQPGATFERELAISDRVYMQRISYNDQSQNYDIYIHDVTLQKRSEEGLRKAQSEQRALLDAIPDMMFVADKNGVLLECKLDERHGDIGQLLGRSFKDLGIIPTDIATLFDEAGREVLEKQQVRELEYDLVNEKGERVFYEARIIPLSGERVMSLVRDVTERKTQELALQESEARNRSLVAGFPDLIFVVDKTGTFLEV